MPNPSDQFWHVDAPHFCAGFYVRGGVVTRAAPILRWAVGKSLKGFQDYAARKGWRVYQWERPTLCERILTRAEAVPDHEWEKVGSAGEGSKVTEPSIETPEGRAALQALADKEYSLEPEWYIWLSKAIGKINELEAKNSRLRDELADQIHPEFGEVWRLQGRIDELKKTESALNEAIDQDQDTIQQFRSDLDAAQARIDDLYGARAEAEDEASAARARIAALEHDLDDARDEIAHWRSIAKEGE